MQGAWGAPHPVTPKPRGGCFTPSPPQVGQYISRAEELKALVTSDSKNLLQQGSPAREVLKGGVLFFFGGETSLGTGPWGSGGGEEG